MQAIESGTLSAGRASRFRPQYILVAVLLAFFAVWCWDLGYPSLSGDEAFVAILTTRPAGEILRQLNADEPHPPAYYLAMRGWSLVAGVRPEFVLRLPSALNGLLLLCLTYRLGRELGLNWPAALAASVLVGLNPQITLHVREARMYGPMATSLAVATLAALRFEHLPRRAGIGIAAAAMLLPLLTHYFNVLFVSAVSLWGLLSMRGNARRRWLASQAVAWAALVVWLPTMGQGFFNPTSLSQAKTWSFTLPPWETLARVVGVGVFGYRDYPVFWVSTIGVVLLLSVWLLGVLRARGRSRTLLLIGVVLPLIAYAMLGWIKPVFHPKYMLPWLLFAALAAGFLLDRRPRLGGAWALAVVLLMVEPAWRTIQLPYEPGLDVSRNTWLSPAARDMGAYLNTHTGPSDVFGHGTPDPAHCYYTDLYFDRALGCELIPEYPTQTLDESNVQVASLLSEHEILWFLDYYNPAWDPEHVADDALAQRALSLGVENAQGNQVRLYTSPDITRASPRKLDVIIGDMVELVGIWVRQGGQLHVVLEWRALVDQPDVSAKVFVHLVDASGRIVSQQDGIPVWWTRPLDTWRRGERILDVYSLALPADYESDGSALRVGMYDPDTSVRWPAVSVDGGPVPDDAVLIPIRMGTANIGQ